MTDQPPAAASPRPAPAPETTLDLPTRETVDDLLDRMSTAAWTHDGDGEQALLTSLCDALDSLYEAIERRPAPAGAPANECSTCHQSDAGPTYCSNPWHLLKAGYTMRDGVVTAPAAGADAGDVTDEPRGVERFGVSLAPFTEDEWYEVLPDLFATFGVVSTIRVQNAFQRLVATAQRGIVTTSATRAPSSEETTDA